MTQPQPTAALSDAELLTQFGGLFCAARTDTAKPDDYRRLNDVHTELRRRLLLARADAGQGVSISREDFDRIAMIVNDARLKLGNKPIDRMRRPVIEAAWSAIDAALAGESEGVTHD